MGRGSTAGKGVSKGVMTFSEEVVVVWSSFSLVVDTSSTAVSSLSASSSSDSGSETGGEVVV